MGLLRRYPAYTLDELLHGPDGPELLRLDKILALAYPPEDQPDYAPGGGEY